MLGRITCVLTQFALAALPALAQQQPQTIVWGYVNSIDGLAVTLDDGTLVRLTEQAAITKLDGAAGTLDDIVKNLKLVATVGPDGLAKSVQLFRPPSFQELFLTQLTTAGANMVSVTVDQKLYTRSLALLKATFSAGSESYVALETGMAYLPPEGAQAPPSARFIITDEAGDTVAERTLAPNTSTHIRFAWAAGRRTLTLRCEPVGQGKLLPEWCVWLNPRFVTAPGYSQRFGIYQSTARRLLDDLLRSLGDAKPEAVAVAEFTGVRIPDRQVLLDLQEDLIVLAAGKLPMIGKLARPLELGLPIPDNFAQELKQLGAKSVILGTVSDRTDMVVINAAVVDVATNKILATGRAIQ